nr:tetracycline resistance protein from transposon [Quercus suber]
MSPPIAILGAGPSGLALGRLLEVAKIGYTIFERDVSATWAIGRAAGGSLDVHGESGQLAIKKAGLMKEFKAYARYEDVKTTLADRTGKICAQMDQTVGTDRPEIDRKDLRQVFLDSIPSHRIRWGKRVQSVQRNAGGQTSIQFADGTEESGFKLVVGADGAWSKVRSLVRICCMLMTSMRNSILINATASMTGQGNYIALGLGKQVAAQCLGDGSYHIYVGMQLPESWTADNPTLLQDPVAFRKFLLKEHFAGWPAIHTDMIEHSEGGFRAWPLYAMPTSSLAWQTVPGVTLVGDAAHVSLQLAQQIIKHGLDDLDQAVSDYEKEMFPRGISLISRSASNGKLLFAPNAPQSFVDGIAEAMPSGKTADGA